MEKEVEKDGENIIEVKDMEGLMKNEEERVMLKEMREEKDMKINLKKNDKQGIQEEKVIDEIDEGVDVVDEEMEEIQGNKQKK